MLTFEKTVKQTRILNPLKEFEEDTLTLEYRTDPLTGRNTTVVKGIRDYIQRFMISDKELISSLVEKSRRNCPFCPESVKVKTPMFTPDFIQEGRIIVGDTIVIPNLTGHAERSVLAILSKEHHLVLKEFTPTMILNGFQGGRDYLRRLHKREASIRFPVFVFNYLPPAGSSIFHPHMQVLVRDRPFYLARLQLENSRTYYERHGSSYWKDLLHQERDGKRYLFGRDAVQWFVPFAPLRGLNEVQAVIRGRSNLLEVRDREWTALVAGILRILRFYHKEEIVSFNLVIVSGPMDEHLDYFDVNLRIMSRPGIQASGFTDAWALPYFLWDGEAVEEPEALAERIKESDHG